VDDRIVAEAAVRWGDAEIANAIAADGCDFAAYGPGGGVVDVQRTSRKLDLRSSAALA
jgi:hypothetical protein